MNLILEQQKRVQLGSYLNPDRITEEDTTLYLTEEDSNEQIISED
jgi:hypothetical protein